jgi:hypothetical protein
MNDIDYQRIAGRILRGLIAEANAQAFQDLFWKVATAKFDNFEKVKPQGKNGDRKNDGYIRGEGVFYQVYSPENPKENTQNAVKKLMEDFNGLYSFWNGIETIKEFNFVFNDKFQGSYPDLYKEISTLEKNHTNIKFNLFRADDLQRMFKELSPEKQDEILHLNSNETILSYEAISTVAEHLKSLVFSEEINNKLIAPDFEEKISFNHLSPTTAEMLKKHYENISEVEKYFSNVDNKELKKELQEKFTHLYNGAVKKYGEPLDQDVSENIFFDILTCSSSHGMCDPAIRKASLSLMALYFESCDIYKEPK